MSIHQNASQNVKISIVRSFYFSISYFPISTNRLWKSQSKCKSKRVLVCQNAMNVNLSECKPKRQNVYCQIMLFLNQLFLNQYKQMVYNKAVLEKTSIIEFHQEQKVSRGEGVIALSVEQSVLCPSAKATTRRCSFMPRRTTDIR